MVELGRLSLRKQERGLLIGGTGVGKSWLAESLLVDFHERYPTSRLLILDSKPRFKAEWLVSGRSAKRRYRHQDHGSAVPGSVVVSSPAEMATAWGTGHRIVIAQSEGGAGDVPALVDCAQQFFDESRSSRPQLLVVDESMDFFRSNGARIGRSDALLRVARAGRERGIAALYCSQRTRGIPAQLMEELTKLYLFRLDYRDDLKRLQEMGAPRDIAPPSKPHEFAYWTKADYGRVWGPYKLAMPRA